MRLSVKRSEAIKLITDIISEVTYPELAKKRAKKVLDALEGAGMLPPSYTFNSTVPHPFNGDEINDWESENLK